MTMASKPRNVRFSQIGIRPLTRGNLTGGLVDVGDEFTESPLLCMATQVSSQHYADDLSTCMRSLIDSLLERRVKQPNEGLYCTSLNNKSPQIGFYMGSIIERFSQKTMARLRIKKPQRDITL